MSLIRYPHAQSWRAIGKPMDRAHSGEWHYSSNKVIFHGDINLVTELTTFGLVWFGYAAGTIVTHRVPTRYTNPCPTWITQPPVYWCHQINLNQNKTRFDLSRIVQQYGIILWTQLSRYNKIDDQHKKVYSVTRVSKNYKCISCG